MALQQGSLPGTVRWAAVAAPGPEPGRQVPVRIYQAGPAPRGWLVWAHGGSWSSGSSAAWHQPFAELARAASATVVGVDYRLAPANPHPAAILDVLAVMEWVRELTDGPISVGGDSAGATIAASAALEWRDRGLGQGHPLAAQVLAYPPLDPEARGDSYTRDPGVFPSRASLMAAWRTYLGTGGGEGLRSTPFEAEDLGGAGTAILAVGSLDPVADDVREYARRLREAGNDVTFREFEGGHHGAFLTDPGFRRWLGTTYADVYAQVRRSM
ncbi:alpha/beta hydrolase fold domain-containing protein [Actinomadura barringtoniae]|uniref:Alpha/beta hydrolase fold domain-containing protein n=1 Tax=Actinomadura barringtoniae TaxID=1427535 RepID=A0A939TEQ3_9ACTN|nr:alpha/beta hydrolase fold domain-containing protein [Actinomadura barringtoniae]MBO2453595.1 alpha/beta hydrolase fold domain-containing protein [Actinomadura barringtoniae]